MGRGTRASAARPRQAEASEGGRAGDTDGEGVRLTFSRRIRKGESSEAERHRRRKKRFFGVHLIAFGDKRLDAIQTEDVQRLKAALRRAPKTVNNVLTVLSVMLRTAVDWGVIERIPCSIQLLKTTKSAASFYDFDEYERLVEALEPNR